MSQLIDHLVELKLIDPPAWLPANVHYLTMAGSQAYGVADEGDEPSDLDLVGICIPPKEIVFPHLAGEIWGFGAYKEGMPAGHFAQYQKAHVVDASARAGKGCEYDLHIYNIVKYVQLCSECNPNLIDSLFTPESCVVHCSRVGQMLREHRRLFLHRGVYDKFIGYAYAQVKKLHTKEPRPDSKRARLVTKYGLDTKFAYHVVRLVLEAEQILQEGDLDLTRNAAMLRSIRAGTWSLEEVDAFFERKRTELEQLRDQSSLPARADRTALKQLLFECLEAHYGSLENAVVMPGRAEMLLRLIRMEIERAGY